MDPFWQALPQHSKLPEALKGLHGQPGLYSGRCSIETGQGWATQTALKLGGFPPASKDIPIRLKTQRIDDTWIWTRDFDGHIMRSWIRFDPKSGLVREKAGALTIGLRPVWAAGKLRIGIAELALFRMPCPAFLIPQSSTAEWQDPSGRFCFDVSARSPRGGLLTRYHGWLTRDHAYPCAD